MSKKTVKLGVVGLKRGADVTINAAVLKNVKLCAACDHNPETLKDAKKRFEEAGILDCVYYSDYDEMLKSDIDAVFVATEAVYHVPIVKKAMEAGKHVLSEIPPINSVEEAYELKQIVASHPDLIYMAGENCCYWAFIETWKRMRENGDFGEVVFAEAEYLHSTNPDEITPEKYADKNYWRNYNPAIKYITHELGPLLYIMDDRCVSVTCMEPDVVYNPYIERKSVGLALIKTAKGAVIRILISFGAYTGCDHNYRVCGTRGQIETDHLTSVRTAHSYANLHSVPGTFEKKIEIPVSLAYEGEDTDGDHGGADRKMLADFVACVAENRKPILDVDFGINMAIPGILAHESAVKGGMPMEIPQI